jgi:hypothetical protein
MAQTIAEIQAEILTEKANHTELDGLTSDSNTSVWGLWVFVVATVSFYFQTLWDNFQALIQSINSSKQYGTDSWWYQKLLAFQYGDTLQFINNIFQYAVVDGTKQIVNYCAINSLNGVVQIKVATAVNGAPAQLSADQLNGVSAYVSQIVPTGIRWSAISLPPDLLQLWGTVYYDAAADVTVIGPAVTAAIQNYLNGLNTVQTTNGTPVTQNFNGALYVNKLIDAIQAVPGLVGNQFDLTSIAAKNSGGVYALFTSNNVPESGYYNIDPAYPLTTTLTFTPVTL